MDVCLVRGETVVSRHETSRHACWLILFQSVAIQACSRERGAATAGGVVGGGCRDVAGLIRPDTAPAPRCNLQGLAVMALNMCYIGALSFTRCCTCRSDLIEVDPQ
ncbi:hypothetical protein J6590_046594 [Homalodisca vitripennis]|nr:hypothetical protein J6590_046594 [Homalodisca vitripennis]